MPTIDDLPQIQDMATKLLALEVNIYQDCASRDQVKTDQQIATQARSEFAASKQADENLIKDIKIQADQKVQEMK
jgi:hypothetical protein